LWKGKKRKERKGKNDRKSARKLELELVRTCESETSEEKKAKTRGL
jgi:hypothetical protein